jgi:fumarate hydratase, class II
MPVTALSPVICYEKASEIAHYAIDNELTLKAAARELGFVTEELFKGVVDPTMVKPYVAGKHGWVRASADTQLHHPAFTLSCRG